MAKRLLLSVVIAMSTACASVQGPSQADNVYDEGASGAGYDVPYAGESGSSEGGAAESSGPDSLRTLHHYDSDIEQSAEGEVYRTDGVFHQR